VVLDRAWTRRVRIRHLRLCLDRLTFPPAQLDLFEDRGQPLKKDDRLMQSLDAIRGKFGVTAVYYGRGVTVEGAEKEGEHGGRLTVGSLLSSLCALLPLCALQCFHW
jgi:hypothetical protein